MATGTTRVGAEPAENPNQVAGENLPLEDQIRRRAHEIWLANGSPMGTELLDWQAAEYEILIQEKE